MVHENSIGFGSEYRKRSEQQEAWVASFLDTYFYPRISKNFKRNTDTQLQKLGVDLFLTGATKSISIDEKASVEWCNVGLNKFSMELSFLSFKKPPKPYEVSGWYLSNCISTHLALIFIDSASTVNDRYLTGSGITEATVVVINKEDFQCKLDKIGWTKSNLKRKSDLIRQAYNEYGDDYWKHVNCGKLTDCQPRFFLTQKKEHGISVQFTRNFLIKNAEYAAHVTKNKITKIKIENEKD